MRRMHRKLGRTSKQAYGINKKELTLMIKQQDNSLYGLRNKALLVTAFDTLCRRSELCDLRIEDLKINKDGTGSVLLRKSKIDQEKQGSIINLNRETITNIKNWIGKAKINEGCLFRGIKKSDELREKLSVGQINRIFKKTAQQAKIEEDKVVNISGHSLRVGAAKELAKKGVSFPNLMNKGRWTKIDTVMKYIQN